MPKENVGVFAVVLFRK